METKSEFFAGMGVTVISIGSLVEETRVGKVDEADCFIMLNNLKPHHFSLLENSSTRYRVTEAGKEVLPSLFLDEQDNLNYFNFLRAILFDLSRFFHEETLPQGMTAHSDFQMCDDCGNEEGPFGHLKHCKNCRPAVTFTKAGPCSILDDEGTVISIDLIPLLPCANPNPILLFNKVTSALVKGDLPNWLPYLKKFVKSDGLLPEVLGSAFAEKEGFTAMKLLHAQSDEDMFILRPGQKLAMNELQEPKLKRSYCYQKALKTIMKLDLSSFSLKKVLLLEDFTRQARSSVDDVEILFAACNHPHLKSSFQDKVFEDGEERKLKINFPAWQRKMDDFSRETLEIRNMWSSGYKLIPLELVND